MARGDANDMAARMRAVLATKWFPDITPVLDALLGGLGTAWAALYDQILAVRLQARIMTATGAFLDMAAADFFGTTLTRRSGEGDAAFSTRIRLSMFRPRNTRAALNDVLTELTGTAPTIFEPALTTDTGSYNAGGVGYGAGGGWGSLRLPYQAFVTAYRPAVAGAAGLTGYYYGFGWAGGGYGGGAIEYTTPDMTDGTVTDQVILDAINQTKPTATIIWTRIANSEFSLVSTIFARDEAGNLLMDDSGNLQVTQ